MTSVSPKTLGNKGDNDDESDNIIYYNTSRKR